MDNAYRLNYANETNKLKRYLSLQTLKYLLRIDRTRKPYLTSDIWRRSKLKPDKWPKNQLYNSCLH